MSYPKLKIDISKLRKNVQLVVAYCKEANISLAGVTKAFCGNTEMAKIYVQGGVEYLTDSRIENLKKLKEIEIPKIMLRLPMISEIDDLLEYADISLNSEIDTIKEINKKSMEKGKIHKIILMVDLGDLREGFFYEDDLIEIISEIKDLEGVELYGIGTNMACYGGIIPMEEHMRKLGYFKELIKENFDLDLKMLSGGNSASLHLIEKKQMGLVNNLRLGEALLFGEEPSFETRLEGSYNDIFTLELEIIEIKEKPSMPIGRIGKDAFGNIPTFNDLGIRKRIICAIGKQDIDFSTMYPYDKKLTIFGGSSDHIILDGTDSLIDYKVGDIVSFRIGYVSLLRSMTSEYVEKEFINIKE